MSSMDRRSCATAWARLTLFALLGLAAASARAQQYTITDLGAGLNGVMFGDGLNNNGDVVGEFIHGGGVHNGFIRYHNGPFAGTGSLGGRFTKALAINDAGVVVGDSDLRGGGITHGFVYQGGVLTDLGTFGGRYSSATAINNHGQVVGYSTDAAGVNHLFLYQGSAMQDLGAIGGLSTIGDDINDLGQIVGSYVTGIDSGGGASGYGGFLYKNGTFKTLAYPGMRFTYGVAINDHGWIAGYASTFGNPVNQGFLYHNGRFTDLALAPGVTDPSIRDINDAGVVVGQDWSQQQGIQRALVDRNGMMTDLNSLIPANSGWFLEDAAAINDSGQITGTGFIGGQTHAYLLTPTGNGGGSTVAPEPGTLALTALGLLLFLNVRLRQSLRRRGLPSGG